MEGPKKTIGKLVGKVLPIHTHLLRELLPVRSIAIASRFANENARWEANNLSVGWLIQVRAQARPWVRACIRVAGIDEQAAKYTGCSLQDLLHAMRYQLASESIRLYKSVHCFVFLYDPWHFPSKSSMLFRFSYASTSHIKIATERVLLLVKSFIEQ